MRTVYPSLIRALLVIFPIVLIALAVYWSLSFSLPITTGTLNVGSIKSEVVISYDQNGIANISAKKDIDAFYSMGFVHAQNRMWQMEMNRKTAKGELSSVLGLEALGSDIFMRTLGLRFNATKMWNGLSIREQEILQAYVDGVNDGIQRLPVLPVEYYILGFKPEPWSTLDSLIWMQLLTVQLSGNLAAELQRSMLYTQYGKDKVDAIYSGSDTVATTDAANFDLIDKSFLEPKSFVGSNAFVVSGRYTLTGKPLLANDPHLFNSMPAVFYMMSVQGDDLDVSGATFPGLPFVVIGHNQNIAWGITNMMADTQDIFLERMHPQNANQYELDGRYVDMDVHTERIAIKAKYLQEKPEDHVIEVRRTHRGPVLSDINGSHRGFAYSLRWTGDDQNGGTFRSFVSLNYAQNWQQFEQALKTYIAPIHSFVYADRQGHIGVIAPGYYPNRPTANGSVVAEGWHSKNDWNGSVVSSHWPKLFDPKEGYVVSANNRPKHVSKEFNISSDFAPNYRANRIEALLRRKVQAGKLGVADLGSIQLDIKTSAKASLIEYLSRNVAVNSKQRAILNLIEHWDGQMTRESVEASIYIAWMAHFNRLLLIDDAERISSPSGSELALQSLVLQDNQQFIENTLLNGQDFWCDFLLTQTVETCDELLAVALSHAIKELEKLFGDNIQNWHWGDIHKAKYSHFPFSSHEYATEFANARDRFLSPLFSRIVPAQGGGNTVNVGSVDYKENSRYWQFFGASFRQVIDLNAFANSKYSLATGQSGNVISKHYDDLLIAHQNGEYFKINKPNTSISVTLLPNSSAQ